MIHLLTYPANFGAFSPSPFCVKAAMLLHASGQAWQREDLNDPRKMPQGKLPAIRAEGRIIADSDAIRRFLEQRGTDFSPGLSEVDKAHGQALIRLAEEHLYFHLMMDRWGTDAVWPTLRDAYFSVIPGPLRGFIAGRLRQNVMRGLRLQGLARMPAADRLERVDADVVALSALIGQNGFLLGSSLSLADYSVAAMLDAMRGGPVPTEMSRRIGEDPVLTGYLDLVNAVVLLNPGDRP